MGRNRKSTGQANLSPAMEKIAVKVAGGILLVQRKWAAVMNRLFTGMPGRYKWITLITCSILMIVFSGVLIIDGFQGKGRSSGIKVDSVLPVRTIEPASDAPLPSQRLPAGIRNFRLRLDSIGATREGRRKLDSFLRQRPGLLDSLNKIESIYKQH